MAEPRGPSSSSSSSAPGWLPVAEALDRILAAVHPLPGERVPIADAVGRVAAEDVTSALDQPPWDNSAMDGFAVRAEDIRDARAEEPVSLRVVEEIPAGGFPGAAVGPGQATRIMTGAPMPRGADSVVRVEHTDAWVEESWSAAVGDRVRVLRGDDAGRNVRARGEDIRKGTVVLRAGEAIRPAEVGVLATVARTQVLAHRRPRVAILSNGDELVEPDALEAVLAGRRIVNSNSYALAAAVHAAGGNPILLGIAADDEVAIRERLASALTADAVVTTAGASVGEHDHIKPALATLGFQLDFWRVRIRPGSPFSFGWIPRTAGGARKVPPSLPVFGLPGNPVSALVTFEILVRPALLRLSGFSRVRPPAIPVRAAEPLRSREGLVHFLRVRCRRGGDGAWEARLTGPQGSGMVTSMAWADALLAVPEERPGLAAGDWAWAVPLRPPEEWSPAPPDWSPSATEGDASGASGREPDGTGASEAEPDRYAGAEDRPGDPEGDPGPFAGGGFGPGAAPW